jgi:hypothetical protein
MAHWMLSLLFMSIELLPVLMKVLLNFGPRSTYDTLAEIRAEGDIAIEEMQQQARRTVEEVQQELYVMAEKERVDRQKEALEARRRAAQIRAEEARIADIRAAAARAAARAAVEARAAEAATVEEAEPQRRLWDTGPIRGLAGLLSRRADREPVGV